MASSSAARFSPGDRVRVGTADPPGHCRTPGYVRGKTGRVVRLHGTFHNPESLAYWGSGLPKQPLYQVEFDQTVLWDTYGGAPGDKVWVDIYQHWLETA